MTDTDPDFEVKDRDTWYYPCVAWGLFKQWHCVPVEGCEELEFLKSLKVGIPDTVTDLALDGAFTGGGPFTEDAP